MLWSVTVLGINSEDNFVCMKDIVFGRVVAHCISLSSSGIRQLSVLYHFNRETFGFKKMQ